MRGFVQKGGAVNTRDRRTYLAGPRHRHRPGGRVRRLRAGRGRRRGAPCGRGPQPRDGGGVPGAPGTIEPLEPHDCDLVVVAVPPAHLADVIADALAEFPRATVTDVGSVKGTVLGDLRARGRRPGALRRVAPDGGLAARRAADGARRPVRRPHLGGHAARHGVRAGGARRAASWPGSCGARVVTLGPAHHDEAVAQVSHLPQLMSSLIGGALQRRAARAPAARRSGAARRHPHRRLATRGCGSRSSPPTARPSASCSTRSATTLAAPAGAVLDEPTTRCEAFLDLGTQGHPAMPGKHGAAAREFAHVVVEIPDAPGALARLFADIDEAGVNVEDVSHRARPRPRGRLPVACRWRRARRPWRHAMDGVRWTSGLTRPGSAPPGAPRAGPRGFNP